MDLFLTDQLKLFAKQILTFSFSSSVDGVKSVFRKKESGDEFCWGAIGEKEAENQK